ncbi:cell wall hydrolase [uncultured Brevundimonas sp.]|uniref:cell wall hydrolase n=1 Tax=uncultured Brevundimonas sp. TaxID=213418 RepID=UPI0030EEAB03
MADIDWTSTLKVTRRMAAAIPAALAVFGVAMAAGSTPRPDDVQRAEALARLAGGGPGEAGLDPATLAVAIRHDPNNPDGPPQDLPTATLTSKLSLMLGPAELRAQQINAAIPADVGLLRAVRPFRFRSASDEDRSRALRCLTQAVYYEAALESEVGQAAVAQVVLNRVRDRNYANTVCGVVYEGAERVTGCQFSFTCDGALARTPIAGIWTRARAVAERALDGHVATNVGTATHYHANYVHPWWAPSLNKLATVGTHIFYRWKGFSGEPSAFRQAYAGREPKIDEARFARPRLLTVSDEAGEVAILPEAPTTVMVDGHPRVVGIASLGGRRQPDKDEIAAINARLAAFEAPAPEVTPPPPGVTAMAVEEVGRPVR